jgi:uncharacterized protein YjaZ
MKKLKKDLIEYDKSFPEEMFPWLQELVGYSLYNARYYLKSKRPVRIYFGVKNTKKILSHGETDKKIIKILLSKNYLVSKEINRGLPSTIIHEFVHYERLNTGKHKNKTIFECMIEEGIANFIQVNISKHKPQYLDLKNLDEKMLKICWDKINLVLDKSSRSNTFKKLYKNNIYREIYYRLGFGIVREYMSKNKSISLSRLVKIINKQLVHFAKEYLK